MLGQAAVTRGHVWAGEEVPAPGTTPALKAAGTGGASRQREPRGLYPLRRGSAGWRPGCRPQSQAALPCSKCGQCGHAGSWELAHVRAPPLSYRNHLRCDRPGLQGAPAPAGSSTWWGRGLLRSPHPHPVQPRKGAPIGTHELDSWSHPSPGPGSLLGLTRWLSERTGFRTKLRSLYSKHSRAGKSTL